MQSGRYLARPSPLQQLPVHVLCELTQVNNCRKMGHLSSVNETTILYILYHYIIYLMIIATCFHCVQVVLDDLGCAPHILHACIQPHLTRYLQ